MSIFPILINFKNFEKGLNLFIITLFKNNNKKNFCCNIAKMENGLWFATDNPAEHTLM